MNGWLRGNEPGFSGVLKELSLGGEDDQSNISIAKDRDLMGLFEQTSSALREGDLAADFVLYSLELNSPSSHGGPLRKRNPKNKVGWLFKKRKACGIMGKKWKRMLRELLLVFL